MGTYMIDLLHDISLDTKSSLQSVFVIAIVLNHLYVLTYESNYASMYIK